MMDSITQARYDRHFRRIDARAMREGGNTVAERLAWLDRHYEAHRRTAPMKTLLVEIQLLNRYKHVQAQAIAANIEERKSR